MLDGTTGVLVPPRDPQRLAAALHPLITDPAYRARLGENGLRRARRRYDWDLIARHTADAYSQLVRTASLPDRVGDVREERMAQR